MSRNYASFYVEELLGHRPTTKLEDHPFSAVRDWLLNIFAATLHIGGRSPIRNLRTRRAVVTGTHLSQVLTVLALQKALEKGQDRINRLWPDTKYRTYRIWSTTVSHCSAANRLNTTQSELQMELQWTMSSRYVVQFIVDASWNVMAHVQKPDIVFRRNGRVHLNRRGRQFSRLLSAEMCASAFIVGSNAGYTMFRGSVKGTGYPLHSPVSPSLPLPASPCAITFQPDPTIGIRRERVTLGQPSPRSTSLIPRDKRTNDFVPSAVFLSFFLSSIAIIWVIPTLSPSPSLLPPVFR